MRYTTAKRVAISAALEEPMNIAIRPKIATPDKMKRTPRDRAFVKRRNGRDYVCFPLDEDDDKHVELPFYGEGECYVYDDGDTEFVDRITHVRIVEIVVEEL